jgi:cadmium resistance protein CadD (predicted permease)
MLAPSAHLFDLVAKAVVLYMSTDIDDFLVLLVFLADRRFRIYQVVAGQFIGIAVLYGLSVAGSLVSLVVPPAFVGLLGIVPIAIGLKKVFDLRTGSWLNDEESADYRPIPVGRANMVAVFAVTVANGGDNISIYIPLFAMQSGPAIAIIGAVFAAMTAIWLGFAFWLTQHHTIGAPIRRYARLLVPFSLIALGVLILNDSGILQLFQVPR